MLYDGVLWRAQSLFLTALASCCEGMPFFMMFCTEYWDCMRWNSAFSSGSGCEICACIEEKELLKHQDFAFECVPACCVDAMKHKPGDPHLEIK